MLLIDVLPNTIYAREAFFAYVTSRYGLAGDLRAIRASTEAIDRLLGRLRTGRSVRESFQDAEVAEPVRRFVGQTFEVIESDDLCRMASAFTFGREDLLPDVFRKIVDEIDRETEGGLAEFQVATCCAYVELDSEKHGPMATRLVADLCGKDPPEWGSIQRDAAVLGAGFKSLADVFETLSRRVCNCIAIERGTVAISGFDREITFPAPHSPALGCGRRNR